MIFMRLKALEKVRLTTEPLKPHTLQLIKVKGRCAWAIAIPNEDDPRDYSIVER